MWLIWQETEQYGGILYKFIVSLSDERENKDYKCMNQFLQKSCGRSYDILVDKNDREM